MEVQVKVTWQIPMYYILMGASEGFSWQIPQKNYFAQKLKRSKHKV